MDENHLHKIYPMQFPRDSFWHQIKRTVNGKPVSEEDIGLIVKQITEQLQFEGNPHLLDLGCGNAALASRLFPLVNGYTGVDFSPYLLGVAKEYFAPSPAVNYVEADIRHFVETSEHAESYNRVLCYGCMSYLSDADLPELLSGLWRRFPHAKRIFFGNIPNREHADAFFLQRGLDPQRLDDPQSPIGVWWVPGDLCKLASKLGFTASVAFMPPGFYGATYRFDLLLTRP